MVFQINNYTQCHIHLLTSTVYGFEESYVRVYEGSTLEATVGIMKGESIAQNIILISSAISGSAKGDPIIISHSAELL